MKVPRQAGFLACALLLAALNGVAVVEGMPLLSSGAAGMFNQGMESLSGAGSSISKWTGSAVAKTTDTFNTWVAKASGKSPPMPPRSIGDFPGMDGSLKFSPAGRGGTSTESFSGSGLSLKAKPQEPVHAVPNETPNIQRASTQEMDTAPVMAQQKGGPVEGQKMLSEDDFEWIKMNGWQEIPEEAIKGKTGMVATFAKKVGLGNLAKSKTPPKWNAPMKPSKKAIFSTNSFKQVFALRG